MPAGLRINEHLPYPGEMVFRHACKLGLEGIVSKQLGSRYRSGRPPDWLKFKNPERGADTLTSALTGMDGASSQPRHCLYLDVMCMISPCRPQEARA